MTLVKPEMLCMMDIESLDTGPRSLVSQVGLVFAPADDPETIIEEVLVYLPLQPQIILKRTMSASTLVWWMQQSEAARKEFEQNTGDDFDELPSLLRHLIRKYNQIVGDQACEVWAKGPQFDVVNVESLMVDCALAAPWKYSHVRDLRTLLAAAGIDDKQMVRDETKYPSHMAVADCHYQLSLYVEAVKHLRART